METIPITRPVIGAAERDAVLAVLESGQLVQGLHVEQFEEAVASVSGRSYAIALTNCTAALRVALVACGVGPGDRVAVTSYSWVATANVIELLGAMPVFVDVDPSTFNIDVGLLGEELSRGNLSAVLAVDTFGNPAGMQAIEKVCAASGVTLIEDAACALGAHEAGRPAGGFGSVACFSFHPRKIITTGEGGMLVTDDGAIAEFARTHRNHGQSVVDGSVQVVAPGDNLRMTDIQAALGVAQMQRLDELVAARSSIATRYDDMVEGFGCRPQQRCDGASVQSYVVVVPASTSAGAVIASLQRNGIGATIGTNAIPFLSYYRDTYGYADADFPVTADLRDRAVTLPCFPGMTTGEQDRVLAALRKALR